MERTGRNPQNIYLQLGCSKHAEQKMLHYVRNQCIGKPFSNLAMFRSLLWPRQTDDVPTSFFCAELVAAILRQGGLMDSGSNPGAATPEMLHRIYAPRAAVAGNPCVLRDVQASSMHFQNDAGQPPALWRPERPRRRARAAAAPARRGHARDGKHPRARDDARAAAPADERARPPAVAAPRAL